MNPSGILKSEFDKKWVERIDAILKIEEIPYSKSIKEFL